MEENMNQNFFGSLSRLHSLEPQHHHGITIIPLSAAAVSGHSYISLSQAFEAGELLVTELSQGGSVPELKVVNKGKHHILILAGEELRGAKQNRVLNTSVIIGPESELVVPVSCTEAGRWAYRSPDFQESGNMMAPTIKGKMINKVNLYFQQGLRARSDQSEVWDEIDKLQTDIGIRSNTSAMADVYEGNRHRLEDVLAAFPLLEGQCGIYVLLRSRFAGLEAVSSPDVWQRLHAKIVKSYAMDALRSQDDHPPTAGLTADLEALFKDVNTKVYPGIGLGEELRFEKPGLTGAALLWEEEIIHLSAFPHHEPDFLREVFHRHMRPRG